MKSKHIRTLVFLFLVFAIFTPQILHGQNRNTQSYPFFSHQGYVVLLTDLHFPYKQKTIERLLNKITEIKPQHVFLLGDLTEMGSNEEFEGLKNALSIIEKAQIPYNSLLGNHDVRWSYVVRKSKVLENSDSFSKGLYEVFSKEVGNFIFLGIDTTMYFQHGGHIGKAQIMWLEKELEKASAKGKRVILLSHHPLGGPVTYTDDGWEIIDLISKYDVIFAFSGHVHKYDYSGCYNGAWFQTLGAAKDGNMSVLSWDKENAYLWKYNVDSDSFQLIKSIPLEKKKRRMIDATIKLMETSDNKVKLKVDYIGAERIRILANGRLIYERALQYNTQKFLTYEVTLTNVPKSDFSVLLRISVVGKDGIYQRFFKLERAENRENNVLKKAWTFSLEDTIYSKPAVFEDGVIVADYSGNVVFLKDGKVIWRKSVGPVVANVEVISQETHSKICTREIVVGDLEGTIHFFDSTGNFTRQIKLSEPVYSLKKGNSTITICAGRYFYILRLSDSRVIAKLDFKSLLQVQPFFKDNIYFQPSWDGNIYLIDEYGNPIERFNIGKTYYTSGSSTPALVGTLLIYSSIDGTVNAMDIRKKEKIWSLRIPGVGYSAVENIGDFIFISTINGEVYKIDGKNGNIVWSSNIGSSTMGCSPKILDTGQLVLGTNNGELTVIDANTGRYDKFVVSTGFVMDVLPYKNGILVTLADGTIQFFTMKR